MKTVTKLAVATLLALSALAPALADEQDTLAERSTYLYTPEGQPIGLAADKRVICALSRGSLYGEGVDWRVNEHLETYLRSILGYIGVTKLEFIIAEGVQITPEIRKKSHEDALRTAADLALVPR